MEVQWHPTVFDSGNIFFGARGVIYEAVQINDSTTGGVALFAIRGERFMDCTYRRNVRGN